MAGHRHWRQDRFAPGRGLWPLMLLAVLATGCKTGSWGSKPSWWSFGGTAPSSSLTAAPAFEKDVAKPSETSKPYPTTDTPEGYSLAGPAGGSGPQTAAAPPAMEQTSVTYGASPPPTSQVDTTVRPEAAPAASIGPQVGPYASLQPSTPQPPAGGDPAAAVTAGLAAAPAFGEATPPPAARVADARGSTAWAAPPPAAATGDGRYGQTTGSRFSSGFGAAPYEPPPAAPPVAPIDPLPGLPSGPPAGIPAAAQPFPPTAPPAAPAAEPAGVGTLPGAIPPPTRRPDPGYRPGGTSSYRPSRAILAGDDAAGGVLPASFEASAPGG